VSFDPAGRAGAILEIDLGAIVANWRLLRAKTAPAACAAVVKANAYGLGADPVAQALAAAGCQMFFVATLDEGMALRRALGGAPKIAVLNGPPRGAAGEFVAHDLIPVLNEPGQIEEWAKQGHAKKRRHSGARPQAANPEPIFQRPVFMGSGFAAERRPGMTEVLAKPLAGGEGACPAILHVDTGMARLGLTARELAALLEKPPAIPWRAVMSHLACADDPGHKMNPAQRARFAAMAARLPGLAASLAASSGIFLGPEYHFGLVRPGAALYGVNPRPGYPNPLRQVVRLQAKIVQIRQIDRGETVGYGAAHVMAGPGRIATVAVGYADGWLRSLSQRGFGWLAGTRVSLIGRVSMDLMTFDVSAVDPALARPGAMIELLGENYTVDDAAKDAGTIGYEILTALGTRYHRIYRAPAAAQPPTNLPQC
jgi:alanine racemase